MDKRHLAQRLASTDPAARLAAVKEAFGAGDEEIARVLARYFSQESDIPVKLAMVATLGKLLGKKCVDVLKEHLKDESPQVRIRVMETVHSANEEVGYLMAVKALTDVEESVRDGAFKLLKKLGKKGILGLLGRLVKHQDRRWRLYAILAMGQINTAETVPALAELARDPDRETRLQARSSLHKLAKHGNASAREILERLGADSTGGEAQVGTARGAPPASRPPLAETIVTSPPGTPAPRAAPLVGPTPSSGSPGLTAGVPRGASLDPAVSGAGPASAAASPSARATATPVSGLAARRGEPMEDDYTVVVPPPGGAATPAMSPAVYKALFGESMPKMKQLSAGDLDEGEERGGGGSGTAGEVEAAEEPVELAHVQAAAAAGPKPKWQMNSCRTCGFARKDRPDKQKMAPMRLWCGLLRKETSPTKTCPRGKWD